MTENIIPDMNSAIFEIARLEAIITRQEAEIKVLKESLLKALNQIAGGRC